MAMPNPMRGEVAMPFGDREIILRLSYGVLGQLIPLLDGADEATVARRREAFKREAQLEPPDPMEWQHHLLGAIAAFDMDITTKAIKLAAAEHHPDLTTAQIEAESPPFGPTLRAFFQAVQLQFWRPGQQPKAAEEDAERLAPFASTLLSTLLSKLRSHGTSAPASSGNSHASS